MGHRINGGPNTNDPRLASEIGTGFLMNQGYTMVWSGWQADVSPEPGRMRGEFPIPTQADGSPVTGTHRHEFIFDDMTNPSTATLNYPAADLDPSLATLTVRQHERDPRQTPADFRWSYISEYEIRIDRPAGFDGGAIYEFVYPAKDPVKHESPDRSHRDGDGNGDLAERPVPSRLAIPGIPRGPGGESGLRGHPSHRGRFPVDPGEHTLLSARRLLAPA